MKKNIQPDFETLKTFILSILPEGKTLSDETIKKIAAVYVANKSKK